MSEPQRPAVRLLDLDVYERRADAALRIGRELGMLHQPPYDLAAMLKSAVAENRKLRAVLKRIAEEPVLARGTDPLEGE